MLKDTSIWGDDTQDEETQAATIADEAPQDTSHDDRADKKSQKPSQARKKSARSAQTDTKSTKPAPVKLDGHAASPIPVWGIVVIGIVCALLGGLIGKFFFNSIGSDALAGKTTVTKAELSAPMGSYTFNGQTKTITVEDVIKLNGSLDAALADKAKGTYYIPAAAGVMSYAQNQIILADAKDQGCEVSDKEMNDFAKQQLGTDDFNAVAKQFGVSVDDTKKMVRDAATMEKLRNKVVKVKVPAMPSAPTAPAKGKESVATADYANYIIALAGNEWDAAKDTWKSKDSDFAKALAKFTIKKDAATYEAAQAAYYVSYQKYVAAYTQATAAWTKYVNNLFTNARITVNTLCAGTQTNNAQQQ